jgi:hypothetical protein
MRQRVVSSQPRSLGLMPETSSAVTQAAGTCAVRARSSSCPASSGLVAKVTWSGTPAAVGVGGPAAGQVQRSVDHRLPVPAGLGQVDRDLGVVDLAAGAGVLAGHPDAVRALLAIARLVDHQDRLRVAKVVDNLAAYVVTHLAGVPHRPAGQLLQASGLASPACLAIVQQCLPGRSVRSPYTKALARRRGSTRVHRPAMRPSNSSRAACQRAGSMLWPTATV